LSKGVTEGTWHWEARVAWGITLVVSLCVLRALQATLWRRWFGSLDFHATLPFAVFLAVSFIVFSVGMIGFGIVRFTRTPWADLGWTGRGWMAAVGKGILGFLLLFLNVLAWAFISGNVGRPPFSLPGVPTLLLAVFFAFGIPAWVEENLYRGYLQPLLAQRMSLWIAIPLQAGLFSLAHLGYASNPLSFASAFIAGLVLGILRGRDRSIIAPFLAHGLLWVMAAFGPPSL
jgi:membrane protease YdiL (CAAX protease family)